MLVIATGELTRCGVTLGGLSPLGTGEGGLETLSSIKKYSLRVT